MSQFVALVTGGTSGIGLATALRLLDDGFTVVVTGRRPPGSGHFDFVEVDHSEPGAAEAVATRVLRDHGRLDVLVNNAGTMLVDDVIDARSVDWQKMAAVNLLAATECTRAALPHLLRATEGTRGCADIVFVGSLAATTPTAGRSFYSATKAAIRAFANVLRIELADSPVRTAVVSPGLTATNLRAAGRPESVARMAAAAGNLAGVRPIHADRIGEAISWIVTRPSDVSIGELVVMPTSQGA